MIKNVPYLLKKSGEEPSGKHKNIGRGGGVPISARLKGEGRNMVLKGERESTWFRKKTGSTSAKENMFTSGEGEDQKPPREIQLGKEKCPFEKEKDLSFVERNNFRRPHEKRSKKKGET